MDNDNLAIMKDRKLKLLARMNDERKQKLEKRKEWKTKQFADDENINNILAQFEALEDEIMSYLKKIEDQELPQESLAELFDLCYCKLEEWQKTISLTSHVVTSCHKKLLQEKYHNMNDKRLKFEQTLVPEKKFSFKRVGKKPRSDELYDKPVEDVPDAMIEKPQRKYSLKLENEFGLANKENENFDLIHEQIFKRNVMIRNLKNCKITLEGGPSTVHFISLTDCRILCGPISTSAFIEKCQSCTFIVACQQLRVHNTLDCDFYLHVASRPIIEYCTRIRLAPYNWKYENIDEHFKSANLNAESNNWNLVQDFNWLSSAPSPNWNIINEKDRVSMWD